MVCHHQLSLFPNCRWPLMLSYVHTGRKYSVRNIINVVSFWLLLLYKYCTYFIPYNQFTSLLIIRHYIVVSFWLLLSHKYCTYFILYNHLITWTFFIQFLRHYYRYCRIDHPLITPLSSSLQLLQSCHRNILIVRVLYSFRFLHC